MNEIEQLTNKLKEESKKDTIMQTRAQKQEKKDALAEKCVREVFLDQLDREMFPEEYIEYRKQLKNRKNEKIKSIWDYCIFIRTQSSTLGLLA